MGAQKTAHPSADNQTAHPQYFSEYGTGDTCGYLQNNVPGRGTAMPNEIKSYSYFTVTIYKYRA